MLAYEQSKSRFTMEAGNDVRTGNTFQFSRRSNDWRLILFVLALSLPCTCSFRIMHQVQHTFYQRVPDKNLQTSFQRIQSKTFVSSSWLLRSHQDDFFATHSRPLPSFVLRKSVILYMGKGDGKKRRKKKSASASATHSPSSSPRPAPRVSTDINISVRQQIRWAKMNKEYYKQASTGFRQKKAVRTKFRRVWDEEEIERKAEERRRKGQDPDWDVILNRTATSPLVIVDGYNIIHRWPRLKKHMVKGDPQRARQLLVDDLENLRSLKGWRIECVFDGTKKSTVGPLGQGPGSNSPTQMDKAAKADVTKHGVRVVFSGVGIEADSYIEARCAKAKNVTKGETTGSFIVASDDSMIRLAGQSAGAHCMSADRFVTELKSVKKAMGYRVEAAVAKANGHAIRPEKLRGTQIHRFGRGSVLIEDKRNRTKAKKQPEEELELDIEIEVEEDENGVPWWAKLPEQS